MFQILGEKTLHQAADPTLVAYCPSMDLIALVTTDEQVFIYRLNGQRVYGAAQKAGKLRVESIKWKPNGPSNSATGSVSAILMDEQDNCSLLPGVMDLFDWLELKAPRSYISFSPGIKLLESHA